MRPKPYYLVFVLILAVAAASPAFADGKGSDAGAAPAKAPAPGTDPGFDRVAEFWGRFLRSGNFFDAAGAFDPDGFELVEGETQGEGSVQPLTGTELSQAASNSGAAWNRLLGTIRQIQEDLTEASPKAAPNRIVVDDSDDLPGLDDDDLPGLDD